MTDGDLRDLLASFRDDLRAHLDAAEARTREQLDSFSVRVNSLSDRVDSLSVRVDSLSDRVDSLSVRLDSLSDRVDSLSVRLDSLSDRVDSLSVRVDSLSDRVDAGEARARTQFQSLDERLESLRVRVDESEERTRAHMEAIASELRRHFDVTADRMERRADRVVEALALVDWKIETRASDLGERMTSGFADLNATIRFSHAHLAHRIEGLEARF